MRKDVILRKHLTEQLLLLGIYRSGVMLGQGSFSQGEPMENGHLGLSASRREAIQLGGPYSDFRG